MKENAKLSFIRNRSNNKFDTILGKYHIQSIYRKSVTLILSVEWFQFTSQIQPKGDIEYAKNILKLVNSFPHSMN